MKIKEHSIFWKKVKYTPGTPYHDKLVAGELSLWDQYWNYFTFWNPLSKKYRYFGYGVIEFDCQRHHHFGFWFFNWSWSYD